MVCQSLHTTVGIGGRFRLTMMTSKFCPSNYLQLRHYGLVVMAILITSCINPHGGDNLNQTSHEDDVVASSTGPQVARIDTWKSRISNSSVTANQIGQLHGELTQIRQQRDIVQVQLVRTLQSLADIQRRLYISVDELQSTELLVAWLDDDLDQTRQLAMALARNRLTTNQPFGDLLRRALRRRLEDLIPTLRRDSARLLAKLADSEAADIVAIRLASRKDTDWESVKAYLALMTALPRADAVEPALEMLLDSQACRDAAGALAAAIEKDLLNADQLARAGAGIRTQLQGDRVPGPQMVRLLAQVANEQDWQKISCWLDAEDKKLKEAAAEVWAASDRSLVALAQRADDEYIRPIVIAAARQRGKKLQTFLVLLNHKPADQQMVAAWRRALLEMAGRLPIATVVEADHQLSKHATDDELRTQLLAAAISRQKVAVHGVDLESVDLDQLHRYIKLVLSRSELHLANGDPNPAIDDLKSIYSTWRPRLIMPMQHQLDLVLLRSYLAVSSTSLAVEIALEMLKQVSDGDINQAEETRFDVGDAFMVAINRLVNGGQIDQADLMLAGFKGVANWQENELGKIQFSKLEQKLKAMRSGVPSPTFGQNDDTRSVESQKEP